MNDKLQTINELAPIASRLREREEQISALKRDMWGNVASLVSTAGEQGRDLLLAKTKLAGGLRWSDWLSAHVPNLPEAQASKYERITTEQITDVRQAIFAFIPVSEQDKPKRLPPAPWEPVFGLLGRLSRVDVQEWPQDQVGLARKSMSDVVERLGGRVEWKA